MPGHQSHSIINKDNSITFKIHVPQARQVTVCGNFSGWQAWHLIPDNFGVWSLTTPQMSEGEVIYKFKIDGEYYADPTNLRFSSDGHGNSLLDTNSTFGSLMQTSFFSRHLNEFKKYVIYLPPGYPKFHEAYPVLYLAGGLLDYEMSWHEKGHIGEVADHLLWNGKICDMVIVMPDKATVWEDPNQQHVYMNYITKDLIPFIEQNYFIDSSKRAIEGLSIGAHFALRIAMENPFGFRAVSSLSCPVSEELFQLATANQETIRKSGLRFRISCGDGEPSVIPPSFKFDEHLKGLGIESECYIGNGPHDWPLWEKEIFNSLQFHSYSFVK